MRRIYFIFLALLVCACSSAPIPEWKGKAYRHLEDYKKNYLADQEDSTEPHFAKARKEISGSNDLNLLATAYLTRYALRTAALEDFDGKEFLAINSIQPSATHLAYYHFLKGQFVVEDAALLPDLYRGIFSAVLNKDVTPAARELSAINDPLSRLVACGVWIKYLPYDEKILQIAINTASANGWRRPLWAYLTKLQLYYFEQGEASRAAAIKERLELLKK